MFRRKRKFNEIDNDKSTTNAVSSKRFKSNNTLPVKKTFARNRRRRNTISTKHLQQSKVEEISESDSDFVIESSLKKKRKTKYSPKTVKKVQTTLDFPITKAVVHHKHAVHKCGPSKCNDCGMLYYSGRTEDDSLHSKFHKSVMNKFNYGYKPLLMQKYIVWNFAQIIETSPYFIEIELKKRNKKYKQLKITKDCNSLQEETDMFADKNRKDLVLCIKYKEFMDLKNKHSDILSVVDLMDRDLGYFTTKQLKQNPHENMEHNDHKDTEIVHSLDQTQSLYCFVERTGHKIVGCVVCEPREFAYGIKIKEANEDMDIDSVERNDSKQKCYIGVVKIWVHHEFRRKNIASVLMDCATRNFIYGTHIERKYVAFCQPTRMGQRFAKKYCDTKHILVY